MSKQIKTINLTPFLPEKHREILEKWLYRTHVYQWWIHPENNLQQALNLSSDNHAIIVADDVSVGYIRWQKVNQEELNLVGIKTIPDGSVDIDIFIGEVDYLGCGIGPIVLKILVDKLLKDLTIPVIIMSTSVNNHFAIKAYQKAGFNCMFQFDSPTYGRCWIMGLEPAIAD
ncbi:GNAT family N-acetyltransferase [Crocosphaera sp. XPORK-15E]|uniref:GNAT family N-acetyltransferase n=1 Tax=Crocosphaera sp. XPORK-15E TaxID=3110247 RepID=UPI002B205061|nr:GNAT family N-acetyltransferase [Crocosphaera sp. XPORK-15E]MEA5532542.1 GNAT family N-acetyltransferase [Crocosphaera sp. XPORK-15E]